MAGYERGSRGDGDHRGSDVLPAEEENGKTGRQRMNIGVWLSYDGTRYDGWQKQGNTDRTIQGKLEAVLEKLEGSPVEVHGSGRTDAGVHAEGQVANFHLVKQDGDRMRFWDYMNRYLPGGYCCYKGMRDAGAVSQPFERGEKDIPLPDRDSFKKECV